MPSVSRRKALACSTVSMMAAASLSRGSNWCSRPRARRTSARQASCSSSERGVTSSRSTASGRWGGLFGRSRRMAADGHEDLAGVGPVVVAVLLLRPRHPDHRVREVPDPDRLPERGAAREELPLRLAAEESHPPGQGLVLPARVASLGDADAADLGERRQRAGHQQARVVVGAADGDVVLPELRHHVAARRGVPLHLEVVRGRPLDLPSRPACRRPAGWCARPRRRSGCPGRTRPSCARSPTRGPRRPPPSG